MARPLRIEYPGAWYHVMSRGSGRRNIVLSDDDRKRFFQLLGETSKIFQIEVHAYSLLDNHYHLLIHTPEAGLGRAMRHLIGVYTQRFNKAYRTDGPLFRGRYKAKLVETDEYLGELVRYIHLNPVKAGICSRPEDHLWTSHRAYLKPRSRPEWLVIDEVLGRFGRREREATRALKAFVIEGIPERFEKAMKASLIVLGSRGFRDWVYENFLEDKRKDREIPEKQRVPRPRISPRAVLEHVCLSHEVEIKDLRESQRGRDNDARGMAVYLLRRICGLPQKEIARWLKCPSAYTVATIQKRFSRKMNEKKPLRKLAAELENSLMALMRV